MGQKTKPQLNRYTVHNDMRLSVVEQTNRTEHEAQWWAWLPNPMGAGRPGKLATRLAAPGIATTCGCPF